MKTDTPPHVKYVNIRPVSHEVEAEVLGLWAAQSEVLDRYARGAMTGSASWPRPNVMMLDDAPYEAVATTAKRARDGQELADLYAKIRMLHQHGVETEYLAERFNLGIRRIQQLVGIDQGDEGFE